MQVGNATNITVSASDPSGVDAVWAELTLPDLTSETLVLENGVPHEYNANLEGTYNIDIYANDTMGNTGHVSDTFSASSGVPPQENVTNVTLNIGAVDFNGTPTEFTLTLYQNGIQSGMFSSSNGSVSAVVESGVYDMEMDSWDSDLILTMSISITSDITETVGLDKSVIPEPGYVLTYGVDIPLAMDSATVSLAYLDALFTDESGIAVFVCDSWSFQNQSCAGTWSQVNATQDASANTMTVSLSSPGSYGFSLKQSAFCGDGVCGNGETPDSCPDDCVCQNGDTRACGTSDVPPCSKGTQTCSDGQWGPCVGANEPGTEICNMIDDDCDGIVDNILGGSTPETTGCRCVGGAAPLEEEDCNNIDDDCDGQIDEGLQRQCGTDAGVCEFGLSTCAAGNWGPCIGGVEPFSEEICGNSLDDDCDGQVDEGCLGLSAGQGAGQPAGGFPWSVVFIVIAVILVALVGFILYRRLAGRGPDPWKELEEKYSGAAAAGPPGEKPATTWEELERKYRKK